MTPTREAAMRQALEAMQSVNHANYSWACVEAITTLKAALAEPVQDPVATWENKYGMKEWQVHALRAGWMPAPPQRKPLSEQDIWDAVQHGVVGGIGLPSKAVAVARAIERAHCIGVYHDHERTNS